MRLLPVTGQPHRVAADGIRHAVHRSVGHDAIQRRGAHARARHLPLLREQSRRRRGGVVRRQAEVAVGYKVERVRHSTAFYLRTAPVQRARLRVAHKLNRHRGRLTIFKREADAQALPAGSKRTNVPVYYQRLLSFYHRYRVASLLTLSKKRKLVIGFNLYNKFLMAITFMVKIDVSSKRAVLNTLTQVFYPIFSPLLP